MQTAIVIPCSARDEAALPMVWSRLRAVGVNVPCFVAPCSSAPPETDLPCVTAVRWRSAHVAQDMLAAMLETGAETVYKMDADMWVNRRPVWMGEVHGLTGYRHPGDSRYIGGAFYGLRREDCKIMLQHLHTNRVRPTQLEDVGVSRLALAAGVKIYHNLGLSGYHPDADLDTADLLHLGQNWPRHKMVDLMHSLASKIDSSPRVASTGKWLSGGDS